MRNFITVILLLILHPIVSYTTVLSAEIGDDGLHKQDWFAESFLDMAEDIQTAKEEGKRLAIIFEQRGCIYCKKLHETVFSDPEVIQYISKNFLVVQYNMFGDKEVIDLDGEKLTEKTAARKWRLYYTPTIMFMPEELPKGGDTAKAAVSVMPGAFGKATTLSMFQWVHEKGYEGEEHFQKYLSRKLSEKKSTGN
ncbi:MAG: thioredoxin family protein [Rhizobiaceae bacterium]